MGMWPFRIAGYAIMFGIAATAGPEWMFALIGVLLVFHIYYRMKHGHWFGDD